MGNWHFAECLRHSAKPEIHSAKALPSAALGKELIDKEAFAECFLSGTRQSLCRVPEKYSAKIYTRQNENAKKLINKSNFFFRGRPPPASTHPSSATGHRSRCIFCAKFTANAAGGIRTHDLSIACLLLYHYTTLWLVSRFRYLSSYIILNRE